MLGHTSGKGSEPISVLGAHWQVLDSDGSSLVSTLTMQESRVGLGIAEWK